MRGHVEDTIKTSVILAIIGYLPFAFAMLKKKFQNKLQPKVPGTP